MTICCNPYGDQVEGLAPDEGDPDVDPAPGNFATWDDYFTYKCNASNAIVDEWIQTVQNFSTLGTPLSMLSESARPGFLNSALESGIITSYMLAGYNAGSAAAVIIGDLLNLASDDTALFDYFADLATAMETNKEDLVCELHVAVTAQGAKNAITLFVDNNVSGLVYNPGDNDTLFINSVNSIADAIFNPNIVNDIFIENTDIGSYIGDIADCTCFICDLYFRQLEGNDSGSGDLSRSGAVRTLNSYAHSNGFHYLEFQVGQTPLSWFSAACTDLIDAACVGVDRRFNLEVISSSIGTFIDIDGMRCESGIKTVAVNISNGPPPVGTIRYSYISFVASSAFTINAIIDVASV